MSRKKLREMWSNEVKKQRGELLPSTNLELVESSFSGRCKCGKCNFTHRIENHCIIRICKHCGDELNVG